MSEDVRASRAEGTAMYHKGPCTSKIDAFLNSEHSKDSGVKRPLACLWNMMCAMILVLVLSEKPNYAADVPSKRKASITAMKFQTET